ncbi:hypothetical protein GBAR_LOCUS9156, partial [Geodia barretti]
TPPGRPSPSSSSSTTPVSSPNKRSLQVEAGGSSNTTQIAPDWPWSRLSDTDRLRRVKFLAERAIKVKFRSANEFKHETNTYKTASWAYCLHTVRIYNG